MQTTGKPKRWPSVVAIQGFQIGVILYRKDTATGSAEHVYTQNSAFYQGKVLPLWHTILYVQEETRKIFKFMHLSYQKVLIP